MKIDEPGAILHQQTGNLMRHLSYCVQSLDLACDLIARLLPWQGEPLPPPPLPSSCLQATHNGDGEGREVAGVRGSFDFW